MHAHLSSIAAMRPLEAQLEQIIERAIGELEDGAAIDVEALAAAHPQFAVELRELLPMVAALVGMGGAGADPTDAGPPANGHALPPPYGQLGDFRLIREIGRGGMGTVYEAEQISMGRRVALKVLPFATLAHEKSLQRFRNEVRAAAALDHPNIVSVYSVGEERGIHYFAMQLIPGQTLAEYIAELRAPLENDRPAPSPRRGWEHRVRATQIRPSAGGTAREAMGRGDEPGTRQASDQTPTTIAVEQARLSTVVDSRRAAEHFRAAALLGVQAAEALQHAHDQGVLHRDVKPGNLMLDGDGKLSITDFGLARIEADAGMTMTGDIIGTLRYMAPEQALGKRVVVDHRADVYSLGATLYELLTLQPAFGDTDRSDLLKQIAFDDPCPLRKVDKSIPTELETIVLKAMAKSPEDRYESAQRMADDMHAFLENRPIEAKSPTVVNRVAKWSRRHVGMVWTALAGIAVLSLALGGSNVLIGAANREANQYRRDAEDAAHIAEQQKALAEQQRDLTLKNLYVAGVQLAHQDWKDGSLSRMSETLNSLTPLPNTPDLRGWEWYYLVSLLKQGEDAFNPGIGAVYCVEWSPDGKLLAVSGEKGAAICDPVTQQVVQALPGQGWVAWSPDGSQVAILSIESPREVVIWDVALAKEIRRTPAGNDNLFALKWRSDGQALAWIYGQTLHVWRVDDVESRKHEYQSREVRFGFRSLAWQPDGRALIVGDSYPTVLVYWDAGREAFGKEFEDLGGRFPDLDWNAQTGQLALATASGQVPVWDMKVGKKSLELDGHRGYVSSVSWRADGERLASAGEDNLVRIWDPETQRQVNRLAGHAAPVGCVDWSPSGEQIASGDDDGIVRIWRPDLLGDAVEMPGHGAMAWDPTGKCLVTNRNALDVEEEGKNREFTILHSKTGQIVRNLQGRWKRGLVFDWSPDGRLIAAADERTPTEDGSLCIWNAESGEILHSIRDVHATADSTTSECRAVAWSPDGKQLASGGTDGLVRIWGSSDGKLQTTLRGHESAVGSALWSPDGRWLATADWRHSVKIWDAVSWTLLWELDQSGIRQESGSSGNSTIAWSPDSQRLASRVGRGGVVVWELCAEEQPRMAWSTKAHTSNIRCVAWSPIGNRIATFSDDRSVKIWNAESGQELLTFDIHFQGIDGLAWSPDGQRLASGDRGTGVLIWDATKAFHDPSLR
jgi:WD40 repeat protein/serine/threonine protein kinase